MIIATTLLVVVIGITFTISIAMMNTRNKAMVFNDAVNVVQMLGTHLRNELKYATEIVLSDAVDFSYDESIQAINGLLVDETGTEIILNALYGTVRMRYEIEIKNPTDGRLEITLIATHDGNDIYAANVFIDTLNIAEISTSGVTPSLGGGVLDTYTRFNANPVINFRTPN